MTKSTTTKTVSMADRACWAQAVIETTAALEE